MGYGQFVGNASVHWTVDHQATQDMVLESRDDQPNDNHKVHVRRRCQGKDPQRGETFNVVLRFDTADQARSALEAALKGLPGNGGTRDVYVTLQVPALRRPNPNAAPPPEVRVYW